MQISVGTTSVRLPVETTATPVVQNLGPGNLYVDHDSAVSAATGFKLVPNSVYEWPHDLSQATGDIYMVADAASTDVRILVVG